MHGANLLQKVSCAVLAASSLLFMESTPSPPRDLKIDTQRWEIHTDSDVLND